MSLQVRSVSPLRHLAAEKKFVGTVQIAPDATVPPKGRYLLELPTRNVTPVLVVVRASGPVVLSTPTVAEGAAPIEAMVAGIRYWADGDGETPWPFAGCSIVEIRNPTDEPVEIEIDALYRPAR
jgi:hypothetical protein